jgi:hypothetical protein
MLVHQQSMDLNAHQVFGQAWERDVAEHRPSEYTLRPHNAQISLGQECLLLLTSKADHHLISDIDNVKNTVQQIPPWVLHGPFSTPLDYVKP